MFVVNVLFLLLVNLNFTLAVLMYLRQEDFTREKEAKYNTEEKMEEGETQEKTEQKGEQAKLEEEEQGINKEKMQTEIIEEVLALTASHD